MSNKRRKGRPSSGHAGPAKKPQATPAAPPSAMPPPESRAHGGLRSPLVRLGACTVFLVVLLAAYLIGRDVSMTRKLDLSVRADQGRTSLALAPELNAVSPGCGCADPQFGELAWYGMSIPSEGFDLNVASRPARDVDRHRWALEALAPEQDIVDWYQSPVHSLAMRVVAERNEHRVTLFAGRVSHLVLVARGSVTVEQSRRNPYAALLPAANGVTSFDSEAGARADEGGLVQVHSDAPARSSADAIFNPNFHGTPDVQQRGPMIDVLGPTVHLRVEDATGASVQAGLRAIPGVRRGDSLDITLSTPFSVRLIPHPLELNWWADLPGQWGRLRREAEHNHELREQASFGPEAQGRFILSEALPPYSVRLANLRVPETRVWRRFAARSESKSLIPPMLGSDPADRHGLVVSDYGLPPVTPVREIGVFGHVTKLTASSLSGTADVGSDSTPIGSGQRVEMRSHSGLSAGRFRLTPLISEGEPTEQADISGTGKLTLDGTLLTRISWLPWVLGAIAAAVLGFLVHAFLSWVRDGARAPSSS
jgi:hypothetical protein